MFCWTLSQLHKQIAHQNRLAPYQGQKVRLRKTGINFAFIFSFPAAPPLFILWTGSLATTASLLSLELGQQQPSQYVWHSLPAFHFLLYTRSLVSNLEISSLSSISRPRQWPSVAEWQTSNKTRWHFVMLQLHLALQRHLQTKRLLLFQNQCQEVPSRLLPNPEFHVDSEHLKSVSLLISWARHQISTTTC